MTLTQDGSKIDGDGEEIDIFLLSLGIFCKQKYFFSFSFIDWK